VTRAYKVAVLSVLYFNQGVPYGFFLLTLPILLRQQGASATVIGSLLFLALPWSLKVLWAPLVDRYGSRRAWIIPLQLLLAATLLGLASTLVTWQLALGVLFVNLCIATQDIAVDGYAVEILAPGERALGNSLQAGAYKVGMLVGGGVLPALTLGADAASGWRPTLVALAALTVPALIAGWFLRAPSPSAEAHDAHGSPEGGATAGAAQGTPSYGAQGPHGSPEGGVTNGAAQGTPSYGAQGPHGSPGGGATAGAAQGTPSYGAQGAHGSPEGGADRVRSSATQALLWRTLLARPGAGWLFAFALLAKFGDNVGTGMFRVFLVDHGWGAARITTVVSSYGLVASIAGSLLMVLPLQRLSRWQAFALAAGTQALFLFGVATASFGWLAETYWAPLLVVEHFASGLVTTVLFTILMDHTPLELPGSGFTALSVLSNLGMGLGSFAGGVVADAAGFPLTFAAAAALALVPIGLLRRLDRTALLAAKTV
jgi:MFS family permease